MKIGWLKEAFKKAKQMKKKEVIWSSTYMMVTCYKIMDLAPDGKSYKTLFHGINGSRSIPFDTWIKADRKWAGEGGTKYWTGFHVLLYKEDAEKYFKKFTDETKTRVIVKCMARNLRLKESSHGLVHLAEEIMIPSKQS